MTNGKTNGTQKGRYVGTWLSKSTHAKFLRIARKERRSIAQILSNAVRQIVKSGSSGIDHAL